MKLITQNWKMIALGVVVIVVATALISFVSDDVIMETDEGESVVKKRWIFQS